MSASGGRPPEWSGPRVGVVVPAAGLGRRMGERRKPWLLLLGEPILLHSLRPFLDRPDVTSVAVALAPEDAASPPRWLAGLDPRVRLVAGGETRTESVRSALAALPDDVRVVVVHDAARPLLSSSVLSRCIELAATGTGAVAGHAAVDTLKEVDPAGRVVDTPDRGRFWHAQTPQAFPSDLLRAAYAAAVVGEPATDDAALVERIGGPVVMVESPPWNLKVTRPEDLPVAELLLASDPGEGRR